MMKIAYWPLNMVRFNLTVVVWCCKLAKNTARSGLRWL